MLVYRGMDIGTAKPTAAERREVSHHLLDLAAPIERFTVARFQDAARIAIDQVRGRGAVPLLVGGSGLYFRAVVDDLVFPGEDAQVRAALEAEADAAGVGALSRRLEALDPVAAAKIEPGNVRRVVRALEVATVTGTPFSAFAAAWERYDPARVRVAGIRIPARAARRPHRPAGRFDARARLARGGRGPAGQGVRHLAHVDPGDRVFGAGPPPRR